MVDLLERLVSNGADSRYHGDFDWAGIRIAQGLRSRVHWTPWRFAADDYRAGLVGRGSSVLLSSDNTATPWDPDLERAMLAAGGSASRLRILSRWRTHSPLPHDVIAAATISADHRLAFWDAMVIRSASELGCSTLWTEDLNPGQTIAGVTITNPFE